MLYQPAIYSTRKKMTYNLLGRLIWTYMGIALWVVLVGGDLPPHLAHLRPQGRAIDTHNYYSYNKISHNPCRVNDEDGVCMFVWECIKTDGRHVGMCMDGFMFGSCCVHDDKVNNLDPSEGSSEEDDDDEVAPGIATKNSSLLLPPSESLSTTYAPQTTLRPLRPVISTGVPSLITSRPIIMQGPHGTAKPSTTSTTPSTTSHPTPSSFTPPKPPTRPTRPPKPTNRPTRIPTTPWWTSKKPKPPPKTTPIPPTTTTSTTTTTTTRRPTTTTTTTTTTKKPTTTTTTSTTTTTTTEAPSGPITSNAHNDNHQCGVPSVRMQPEGRIVNGTNARFGAWPWQVSVRRTSFFGFSSSHRCGGALLNKQWVATAGHCVDDMLVSQIRIRVGEYDLSDGQAEPRAYIERSVSRKVVHPDYNFFNYENDLALVKLTDPIDFKEHISPICLPGNNDLLIGEMATVTGWGRLSEHGRLPSILQQGTVPIISNDKCKNMFLKAGRVEDIKDIFICAGYENGGIDSCQGDSGGPLQVRGADGRYFLAGIISWGIGCAMPNLPGVCTRISQFVPWIMETVL